MSRKYKSYALFIVLLILLGFLVYLLKDLKPGPTELKGTIMSTNENVENIYDADYYNRLGNSLILKRDLKNAVLNFNKAIEFSKNTPQFYVPYTGRAMAKYNLKDCDGAISDAKMALRGDNKLSDMYRTIGICEYINNKYIESIENLTTALSLAEKDDQSIWMSYSYRGASKFGLKDFESAKFDFFKSLEFNKNGNYINFQALCKYYIHKDNYFEALKYLEKRKHFPEYFGLDDYIDAYKIYSNILANHLEKSTNKRKEYISLARENGNKMYQLKPSADNQYNLCLFEWMVENNAYAKNLCIEAKEKAKHENNDVLYNKIDEIIKKI